MDQSDWVQRLRGQITENVAVAEALGFIREDAATRLILGSRYDADDHAHHIGEHVVYAVPGCPYCEEAA